MIQRQQTKESGFSDVDRTRDPAAYVRRLDGLGATPFWREIKRRTYALLDLSEGDRVLDVGCGTGDDVRALARYVGSSGRAVGIDRSAVMVAEARRRADGAGLPVSYEQGDAHHLPFPDESFDGCRVERVLQHLNDAHRALTEIARVTRPGGRIVVVEPDYGTLTIAGADPVVTRAILRCRAEHFRDGRIGRRLVGLGKELGLVELSATLATEAETSFGEGSRGLLGKYVERAQLEEAISTAEGIRWLAELEAAEAAGQYRHAITIFLVNGRKP